MTSEKEYKIRKEAGIPYTILLSKDGKRVVRILTKSLQYAIDKDNSVPTGKELYWPGHFKSLDGKETLDWNPKFTAIGVTVTDDAQKAIEYAKSVYAKYTDPTSVTETVGLQN
jgi:hypothetical protein